jgi:putative transposase
MSVTRQEPVPAGLVRAQDRDGVVGETSHYDGENPPLTGRDQAGGLRLTGEGSMLGELVKAVLERALEAELTAHLGYERHDPAGHGTGNSRNGAIGKTVQTGIGPVGLAVPRDRAGSFEPLLVPKRSGRISGGLDDMIISLYAHVICSLN